MVARVDGAANVHAGANGPVLLEVGVVTFDGRSVGALLLPDLVSAAVALMASVLGCTDVVGRVVVTHGLDDIVLNKWVVGPAIKGKVSSAIGFECTGVVHQPGVAHVSLWVLQVACVRNTDISLAGWYPLPTTKFPPKPLFQSAEKAPLLKTLKSTSAKSFDQF